MITTQESLSESAEDHSSSSVRTFERDVESNNSADVDLGHIRWHPKISPYRLWVLATTIGLGTAKSISAWSGNTYIPTTLEWIAGTVLFLIFFSVSSYDSEDTLPPKFLSWLFEPDCLDAFWFLLNRSLSIQRPKYSSKEAVHPSCYNSHHPALSHYRLLVVVTVTLFGLSKAKLVYCGQSAAMNWTDWALAVPVTTILYVLGLYEYNDSHLWSPFFVADRKFGLSVGTKFAFGIVISTAWVIGFLFALQYTWRDPQFFADHPNTQPPASSTLRAYIDLINYYSLRITLYLMLLGQVGLGFTFLSLTLNDFTQSMKMEVNPVLGMWRRARRGLVGRMAPIVRSFSLNELVYDGPRYRRIRLFYRKATHILLYVLAHLVMLAGCFLILGWWLGVFVTLLDNLSEARDLWRIVVLVLALLLNVFLMLCFLGFAVAIVVVLFSRWDLDYSDSPEYELPHFKSPSQRLIFGLKS